MRRFNTAGPCRPEYQYMIRAPRRLPEAPGLVDQMGYFVVHAPRQTGKTTALRALAQELTATGRYAALHFSCELGQAAGDDYGAAQRGILDEIRLRAEIALTPDLHPPPGHRHPRRTCSPSPSPRGRGCALARRVLARALTSGMTWPRPEQPPGNWAGRVVTMVVCPGKRTGGQVVLGGHVSVER
jgi:hypothetical protein